MEPAGNILQGSRLAFGRHIFLGVPIDLEDMAERILEAVGATMAQIAVMPADALQPASIADPALQRFRRRGPIGDMADAGRLGPGQFQGVELVVVPGAQIDGIFIASALLQAVDPGEEIEAFLELVRQTSTWPRWATS
jgi:hypothetical protein